jgi:hypothetical protein
MSRRACPAIQTGHAEYVLGRSRKGTPTGNMPNGTYNTGVSTIRE